MDTTRLSKGWAYDEQLFRTCSAAAASRSSAPSPFSTSSPFWKHRDAFHMGVLPGMEAAHDTNGYYDSSGYCKLLARYEDTRAEPPGAQYTKWHAGRKAAGDYASGSVAPPMEPCCEGSLLGVFG